MTSEELLDRVYLVTGAASGVGASVTRLLRERGARVVAEDINPVVVDVYAEDDGVVALVGDVSDEEFVRAAVARAVRDFGRIDGLVNNAGRFIRRAAAETTVADFDDLMRINARGAFVHTREVAPHLVGSHGAIVNVASTSGLVGTTQQLAYASSKGAVVQLTRAAAVEFGPDVRVNAVAPGPIDTGFMDETLGGAEKAEAYKELIKSRNLLQRLSSPDEIAEVIVFLLSDRARAMTGAIVPVDGGLTAQ